MFAARIILLFGVFLSLATSQIKGIQLESHKHFHLLPKDCGTSLSDRIIGGKVTALGQYPWLARIGFMLPGCTKKILYRCGGVLITKRYILTAAHCTTDLPTIRCPITGKDIAFKLESVVLGEYNVDSDPDCDDDMCAKPVQYFKPEKVIVHHSYNHPQYANDISLIRLNRKANFNGWVAPICLPHGKQLSQLYIGQRMEVSGWGTTNVNKPSTSKIPMFVKIPTLNISKCANSFNTKLNINSTSQMCVGGEENKDSCGGDSGGPLMHVEAVNGPPKYYAIGLVSFGVKHCGKMDKPAIYTRVAAFMHWILDHIYE